MPKDKAIILPGWVNAVKDNPSIPSKEFYRTLPNYMFWRPMAVMEEHLFTYASSDAVRRQMREVIDHLKSMLAVQTKEVHPLVSKISALERVPHQILVKITHDVDNPAMEGIMVLGVDYGGCIWGVEREYSMNYRTNR